MRSIAINRLTALVLLFLFSMSHMSTHRNKKTYSCTYFGCHKSYNDRNTLKHHCALRHGVHVTSSSLDHPTSRWEPTDTPAASKLRSHNTGLRGNSLQRPISPHVPKSVSNAEDARPARVKPSKRHPSWTLATARKSYDVEESETLTNTNWAPSDPHTVKENPVIISLHDSDFESGPDSPEPPLPSLQPSKVAATSSSSSTSESVNSQQHCSVLLKHGLKPQNKLKRKHMSFLCTNTALSRPEPKSGLISDFPDLVIRTPSPAPMPERRKRKSKDSEKVPCDDPAPPLPAPRPSQKRSQSPCLDPPSQVS